MKFSLGEILPRVAQEAVKQGVDPLLAQAIIIAEHTADGEPNLSQQISLTTKSNKGAVGVGQVMPATLEALKQRGFLPKDLDYNSLDGQIAASVATLRELQSRLGSDPVRLVVGYNASSKAGRRFELTGELPAETSKHLKKVETAMTRLGSTTTSTSKKIFAPGTIEELDEQATAYATRSKEAQNTVQELLQILHGTANQGIEALDKTKEATREQLEAQTALDTARQRRQQQIIAAFGIDSSDPSSRLLQEQATEIRADATLKALQPEIERLSSINPLSDPIGWLFGQFKLAQLSNQWNAAANIKDVAQTNIFALQQQAESQKNLEPELLETERKRVAAAAADIAAQKALLEQARLRTELLGQQISVINTELAWQGRSVDQSLAIARLMAERQVHGLTTRGTVEEENQLKNVNALVAAAGGQPYTLVEWRGLDKTKRDRLASQARNVPMGSLGNSPEESLSILLEHNFLPALERNNPTMSRFVHQFATLAREYADKNALTPQFVKLKEDEKLFKAAEIVATKWRKELGETTRDKLDDTNPFYMHSGIYASAQELKANPIAMHAADEFTKNRKKLTDEEIVRYAQSLALSGTMPLDKVVKYLQDWYEYGPKQQAAAYGLRTLGFRLDDPSNDRGEITYRLPGAVFYPGFSRVVGDPRFVLRRIEDAALQRFIGGEIDMRNSAQVHNVFLRSLANFKRGPDISFAPKPAPPAKPSVLGTLVRPPLDMPSIYDPPTAWEEYRKKQQESKK